MHDQSSDCGSFVKADIVEHSIPAARSAGIDLRRQPSSLGSRLPVVNDIEMKAASSVSKVTICFQASVTDSSADPTGSAYHLSLCV